MKLSPRPGRADGSSRPPYYLLLVSMIFFLSSCAAPAKIVKESSYSKRPGWINSLPETPDALYFIGIKTSAQTLEEGQDAAFKNAVSKIADYIGVRVESVYKEYVTERDQDLSQTLSSRSAALIEKASVVDTYSEKTSRIEKNFRLESHDVYVLVKFSKELVEKEKVRKAAEIEKKIQNAVLYYNKGLESESLNRNYDARDYYVNALRMLPQDRESQLLDGEGGVDGKNWNFIISKKLESVNSKLSQITVGLSVAGPAEARNVFESVFTAQLNTSGFIVNEADPNLTLNGEVFFREGSYVMNNFVCYAEGKVSATRNFDRVTVAVFSFKVRGFHRQKSEALIEAAREAGKTAGVGIAKILQESMKPALLR